MKTIDAGGGAVVFEQAGFIHELDPGSGRDQHRADHGHGRLSVDDAALGGRVEPRLEPGDLADRQARASSKRAARSSRFPTEKGDVRNLTHSSASAERDPAWSPDGKYISYFSDKSGEYRLMLEEQDGLAPPREIALPKPTHYYTPSWSPDSKKLLFTDTNLNVWVLDVATRAGEGRRPRSVDGAASARSIRCGAPTRSGSRTPAGCGRCITRSSSATSRPARRSRSRTVLRTRCGRRGMRAASICGSWRRRTSASRRSGST